MLSLFAVISESPPNELLATQKFWKRKLSNGYYATQILVDVVKQEKFQTLLRSKGLPSSSVWYMIVDEMSKRGAPLPYLSKKEAAIRCQLKWTDMNQTYFKIKNGYVEREKPVYFNQIDDFMSSNKGEMNPFVFLDTLRPSPPPSVCELGPESQKTLDFCGGDAGRHSVIAPLEASNLSSGSDLSSSSDICFGSDVSSDSEITPFCVQDKVGPKMIMSFLKQESEKVDNFVEKFHQMVEAQNKQRGTLLALLNTCIAQNRNRRKRKRESSTSSSNE